MMGGGSKGKDLPHTSLVPESALSADARISDILVKLGHFWGLELGSRTFLGSTHMYYQVSYLFD